MFEGEPQWYLPLVAAYRLNNANTYSGNKRNNAPSFMMSFSCLIVLRVAGLLQVQRGLFLNKQ
jgi:hypothetical protein